MRVLKQEQEPASEEVTEVAPGVLRLQLPISLPGLGHVNTYALEDDRGVALVDPGLPGRRSWQALQERLRTAGFPLARVHTVLVTHSHPDHYGGAPRLARTGATVVAHEDFGPWWERRSGDVDGGDPAAAPAGRPGAPPWMQPTPWGGPSYRPPLRRRLSYHLLGRITGGRWRPPQPDRRLADGGEIELGGRRWVARHTPGHTLDHLCLQDPDGGILLSGDHVLPTITPHIGGFNPAGDPLDDFFRSLDKVAAYGEQVSTVLPAHGHPFDDLAGRAKAIQEHHVERLERLRSAAAELDRPATVQELSTHLFSRRAQGPMADSETFAHLEHLRRGGEMTRREEPGAWEYVLVG